MRYRSSLFLLVIAAMAWAQRPAPPPPTVRQVAQAREYFEYVVHYGIFELGTVSVEIVGDTIWNGHRALYTRARIKSNPRLWFVGYKERVFHSITGYDGTSFFAYEFVSDSIHDREYRDTRYTYDYRAGRVYAYEFEKLKVTFTDLDRPADSGPGLFYESRLHAGRDTTVSYPVYTEFEKGYAVMKFTRRTETRSIPAFAAPVQTYYMEGQADLKGPFGFNGAFRTWYGTDAMRLPLEAHVKVWVGSVQVKLKSYRRTR